MSGPRESKPGHTPGPWSITTADGIHVSIKAERAVICQLPVNNNFNRETTHANARLIAAAPRMLALLPELMSLIDCKGDCLTEACAVRQARALIAEVEG